MVFPILLGWAVGFVGRAAPLQVLPSVSGNYVATEQSNHVLRVIDPIDFASPFVVGLTLFAFAWVLGFLLQVGVVAFLMPESGYMTDPPHSE